MKLIHGLGSSIAVITLGLAAPAETISPAETQAAARKLAASQPSASWTKPTEAHSADLIVFLDDQRVLVGEILSSGVSSKPRFGSLSLLNAASGSTLWETNRPQSSETTYTLLCSQPRLIFAITTPSATSLWALDPSSGRQQWQTELPGPALVQVVHQGADLVTWSQSSGIQLVSGENGSSRWRRPVSGGCTSFVTFHDQVFAACGEVWAFDLTSGELRWQTKHEGSADSRAQQLIATRNGLLVWSRDGATLLDWSQGTTRWTRADESDGLGAAVDFGDNLSLLWFGEKKTTTNTLELVSQDGSTLWRHSLDEIVVSPLTSLAGIIAFTTDEALLGLDAADGTVVFRQEFDAVYAVAAPTRQSYAGVPDVVAALDEILVIDRDGCGLRAYSMPSGELAWETPSQVGRPTVDSLQHELLGASQTDPSHLPSSVRLIDWHEPGPSSLSLAAQQSYETTMRQTARVLADDTSTSFDRDAAILSRQVATGSELARAQVSTSMNRMMVDAQAALATANAVVTIGRAIQQIRNIRVMDAIFERARVGLAAAIRARTTAFRGELHLTGFSDGKGAGVRLVSLRDGTVRVLRYEPVDPLHRVCMVRTEVFGLSPSGGNLVLIGLGLDADRYRAAKSGGIKGFKASILSYDPDLAPILKQEKAEAREEIEVVKSPLFMALAAKDTETVRHLLDQGADPNQVLILSPLPKVLTTPLRFAAATRAQECVELLLTRGAQPTLLTVPGPTALDQATDDEIRNLLLAAGAKSRP